MMSWRLRLLLALFLLSAAGCAKSPAARLAALEGEPAYNVWTERTGRFTFVTENCPSERFRTGVCEEVAGTRNPAYVEFWKYKQYIPARVTIMYGAVPVSPWHRSEVSFAIVGTPGNQVRCESIRTQIKKPRGVAGDDGDIWADPCYGPFYFRHVPPAASEAARPAAR